MIRVTPFRALITLVITYLLSPLPLQVGLRDAAVLAFGGLAHNVSGQGPFGVVECGAIVYHHPIYTNAIHCDRGRLLQRSRRLKGRLTIGLYSDVVRPSCVCQATHLVKEDAESQGTGVGSVETV